MSRSQRGKIKKESELIGEFRGREEARKVKAGRGEEVKRWLKFK